MTYCMALYRQFLHTVCVLMGVTDGSTQLHKIVLWGWVVVYTALSATAVHLTFQLGVSASIVAHVVTPNNSVPVSAEPLQVPSKPLQIPVASVAMHPATYELSEHGADKLAFHIWNAFVLACGLTLLLLGALAANVAWAARARALRELATNNVALHKLAFMRYVQVPGVLTLSLALLAGVAEGQFGSRATLVTIVVFQMIQLSVWLFDLTFELREPLRYAASAERTVIQRLHYASIVVHFSTGCFLVDIFARRVVGEAGLTCGAADVSLFLACCALWLYFVFAHWRLNQLSTLFEAVWPGARVCVWEQHSEPVEEDPVCAAFDNSTIVLRDDSDQRIYTIKLDSDFDAYAYLHKTPQFDKAPLGGADGMHVARVGAGPRIFDPTFTDNEQSTRSVIGRVTLWRMVWATQVLCTLAFALALNHMAEASNLAVNLRRDDI